MYNILDGIFVQIVYNIIASICLVQMSVYLTVYLVQMSVQYTWQNMYSSNECTITWVYVLLKWMYNIPALTVICLVQMSVQYTWQYMFSSNECTIYLTV